MALTAFATKKQADEDGNILALTNDKVSDKYRFIRRDLSRGAIPPFSKLSLKDFRSFYATCVYECYACPHTFNATACQILGHKSISESLHYSNIRVQDLGEYRDSFGVLL